MKRALIVEDQADIRELIQQTVKFSLSGSKLKPRYMLPPVLHPVFIDEDQMRQVIQNLVINAREATRDNGELDIELANTVLESDNASSLTPGEYIRIVIRDHGKGIPPELLPKVFDPYFSTKELGSQKGMGLGLSICYSIVNKHGGGIHLDSKMGVGTTASVYLPAVKP
jgi:signal transduction histidine kinase